MAIRIGCWDCDHCGYEGVLGPLVNCSNCGAPRGKNIKFYLPQNAPVVTNLEEIQRAEAGADWVCSHCESGNKATNTVCYACGNTYDPSDSHLETKTYGSKRVPRSKAEVKGSPFKAHRRPIRKSSGTANVLAFLIHLCYAWWNGSKWYKLATFGVILAITIPWRWYWLDDQTFWAGAYVKWEASTTVLENMEETADLWIGKVKTRKDTVSMTITAHDWKRTIHMEQLIPVVEEGSSVPSGGTYISEREEIDHYEKVLDHYETKYKTVEKAVGTETYVCGQEDLGNGYFKDKTCTRTIYEDVRESYEEPVYRDEPVYVTIYTYEINRWKPAPDFVASGTGTAIYWPETNADGSSLRESGREEMYWIKAMDPDSNFLGTALELNRWMEIEDGQAVPALKYHLNNKPHQFLNL